MAKNERGSFHMENFLRFGLCLNRVFDGLRFFFIKTATFILYVLYKIAKMIS